MLKNFIARRPKARQAPVSPLQEPQKTLSEADAAPAETGEAPAASEASKKAADEKPRPKELGGPSGPEPTRYGDWERKGICVDF